MVAVDASAFNEGAGLPATLAHVFINAFLPTNLTVLTTSDNPLKAQVNPSVIILAGATNATFPVLAVDNDLVDGLGRVNIGVTAAGFRPASALVEVSDNDTNQLTLTLAEPAIPETAGSPATYGTVRRSLVSTRPLKVFLQSSSDLLLVPPSVTIPANGEIPSVADKFPETMSYDVGAQRLKVGEGFIDRSELSLQGQPLGGEEAAHEVVGGPK